MVPIAPATAPAPPPGVSPVSFDPWSLTRRLVEATGRHAVRVAAIDASTGAATNSYSLSRLVAGPQPGAPWAISLTDADRKFRYLSFDFDAKEHDPAHDAAVLLGILGELSIDSVLCQSSGSGGRHVWLGLRDGIDADIVRQLARVAQVSLPSLDLSPLSNAATGAVRPPGAPHRDGSVSVVLSGDLEYLTRPTTSPSDVGALLETLADAAGLAADAVQQLAEAADQATTPGATAVDRHGHLYLVQGTRMMPSNSDRLTRPLAPGDDASAVLAGALARIAKAGHHYADARNLLLDSPAFEHIRTEAIKGSGRRTRRDPKTAETIFARQWRRTVLWVAAQQDSSGSDDTFAERALHAAAAVAAAQERADASPGRWKSAGDLEQRRFVAGGYSDRMVFDALCLLVTRSTRTTVEASTRHLSRMTGLGRESCRTALLRLQAEGWLTRARKSEGVRANFWALTEFSTGVFSEDRSQVHPPPSHRAGPTLRTSWISVLELRLHGLVHDVFSAPGSLGRTAGRVFGHLLTGSGLSVRDVALRSGLPHTTALRSLSSLRRRRLVALKSKHWSRRARDGRTAVAAALGVDGFLARRAAAYEVERQVWVWWCQERARWTMTAQERRNWKRRPTSALRPHAAGTPPDFPAHPTRPNGRMDWSAARDAVSRLVLGAERAAA
jgi:hypothetical protein